MNVKELLTNKELMDSIVEDIEDFPEDTEVTYEVWALGYNANSEPLDYCFSLGDFVDPMEAVCFAETVMLSELRFHSPADYPKTISHFSIEVETVIADPEDEDGGTMNIGTIYRRELQI